MKRVIIELEFEDKDEITDADVYNAIVELMDNDCLDYDITDDEEIGIH